MTFSERKQSESECTLFAQADKEIQKERKNQDKIHLHHTVGLFHNTFIYIGFELS